MIGLCASLLAGCSLEPRAAMRSEAQRSALAARQTEPQSTPRAAMQSEAQRSAPCHAREFPDGAIAADPSCTPGALKASAVANPSKTICRHSYEVGLARREAAAQARKVALMIAYGSPGNPSTYVVSERVPAEDGGNPDDPKNMWPMPLYGWGGALTQVAVANSLHDQICRGRLTARQATRFLEGDWLRRGIPADD